MDMFLEHQGLDIFTIL